MITFGWKLRTYFTASSALATLLVLRLFHSKHTVLWNKISFTRLVVPSFCWLLICCACALVIVLFKLAARRSSTSPGTTTVSDFCQTHCVTTYCAFASRMNARSLTAVSIALFVAGRSVSHFVRRRRPFAPGSPWLEANQPGLLHAAVCDWPAQCDRAIAAVAITTTFARFVAFLIRKQFAWHKRKQNWKPLVEESKLETVGGGTNRWSIVAETVWRIHKLCDSVLSVVW